MAWVDFFRLVSAAGKEAIENVVLVSRHRKLVNRQAHLVNQPTGENIPEVASRNDEINIITIFRGELHEGMNVVNSLSQNTDDVDGVDR